MPSAALRRTLRQLEQLAAERREAAEANNSREIVLERIRLIRERRREYALSQMSEEERADFLAAEEERRREWEALGEEERAARLAEIAARVQRIIDERRCEWEAAAENRRRR